MAEHTLTTGGDVVFVLPEKLGGVYSFVQDIMRYRRPDGTRYRAVRVRRAGDPDPLPVDPLGADEEVVFDHALPDDNLYTVLRRLNETIGPGGGVLVANDWIELAAAEWRSPERAVVFILHGDFDYYYQLAIAHEASIDSYVCYTQRVYDQLLDRLPDRRADIRLLRYGVPIPAEGRASASGPLRLLYLGRLHRDKGVFLLPEMERRLRTLGVDARWTIHGDGPDRAALMASWQDDERVTWSPRAPIDVVRALYQAHDVFVLPSQFEALPVALLEAGAAGVVPVVSDLPSGIPEVVQPDLTGYRVPVGDVGAFVEAIAELATDRATLERMSTEIRALVSERFDVRRRIVAYQELFGRWRDLKRPPSRKGRLMIGSRLDHPWLPNAPVRAIRMARRWWRRSG